MKNAAVRKLESAHNKMMEFPALKGGAGLLRTFLDNGKFDSPDDVVKAAQSVLKDIDQLPDKSAAMGVYETVLGTFARDWESPGVAVVTDQGTPFMAMSLAPSLDARAREEADAEAICNRCFRSPSTPRKL